MLELAAWAWAQRPKAPGQVWRDQHGREHTLIARAEDERGWWTSIKGLGRVFVYDKTTPMYVGYVGFRLVSRVL